MPGVAGTSQHIAGVQQSLLSDESRESGALALEQHVDVARAEPVVCRDALHRKVVHCEVFADVGLDCTEPCCTHAAPKRKRDAIPRGAERKSHEGVYMRGHKRDELVIGEGGL